MPQGPLKHTVVSRFPWLMEDLGFRTGRHTYEPREMGSSVVELRSDAFHLRFVRDPRTVYAEVAAPSEPEHWHELGHLWVVLTGDRPEPQLDGWAWFVRDHAAEIAEALGPRIEKTKAAIEENRRENEQVSKRYAEEWRPQRLDRINRFFLSVLGWIVAAALLFLETLNKG